MRSWKAMFTGIIEAVGEVAATTSTESGTRVVIATPLAGELALGDSLAVNGVCLTVVERAEIVVGADIGPETARVTALTGLRPGALVNLERPLRADSRLGGHFVQGHVDATGRVEGLRQDGDSWWATIGFPAVVARFLIPKGSIAVDGISLTIARLDAETFDIQVIPYTWTHTNLSAKRVGDRVNLECDMIGKYVIRSLEVMNGTVGPTAVGR
jgi:riboflavin synthase